MSRPSVAPCQSCGRPTLSPEDSFRDDMAWQFAHAYCPQYPGDPCVICYDDALGELEKVGDLGRLTDELRGDIERRLKDGSLDILDLAEAVEEGL